MHNQGLGDERVLAARHPLILDNVSGKPLK